MRAQRSRATVAIAALLAGGGCGRVPIQGDGASAAEEMGEGNDDTLVDDASDGYPECPGDPRCGDPEACGDPPVSCLGALDSGICFDGHCGPRLGGCQTTTLTCDEGCALQDAVCAEEACDGITAMRWRGTPEFCIEGQHGGEEVLDVGCADVIERAHELEGVACCCDFPD